MGPTERFAYEAPAEIYSSGGTTRRKQSMSYRRFPSSAQAIRFAIEELPQIMQRGTVMEVGDDRFEFEAIRALYDSADYPLVRGADSEADSAP